MAQPTSNETTNRVQEENKMLKDKLERANQQIKLLAVKSIPISTSFFANIPSLHFSIERQCFKLSMKT